MSDLRQRAEEFFQRQLRIRQRYGRDCNRAEHQFKEVVPEQFIPHELPGGLVEHRPGPNYQAALDRALEDRNRRLKVLEEEFSEVVNDPMFAKMDSEFRVGRLKNFFEEMAKQEPESQRTPDTADWWKGTQEPTGAEDPADWWKKAWVLKNCRFAMAGKDLLNGLMFEARKCKTFEEFEQDFLGDIKHGMYWHVTDNPNFSIDPTTGPRDMSSMGKPTVDVGKIMITSHLDHWASYYGKARPYAALIDMSEVPKNAYRQVNRGFGNEFFVFDTSKAKVVEVMPIAKARRLDRRHHAMLPNSSAELRQIFETAHANEPAPEPLTPDPSPTQSPQNPKVIAWVRQNCRFAHAEDWVKSAEVPPEPGTAPIPPNHVRLYHYTRNEASDMAKHQAAMVIKTQGIDISKARGSTYGEPNAVWASRSMPGEYKVFAEFSMATDDPRWAPPWGHGRVPSEGGDCYFTSSIRPEEIIAVHEPWHHQYRYLVENGMVEKCQRGEFDHLLKTPGYGPAVMKAKGAATVASWVYQNCRFARSVSDDPEKWMLKTRHWAGKAGAQTFSHGPYTITFYPGKGYLGDLVAREPGGNVVGSLFFDQVEGGSMEGAVEVDPNHRRKGIASQLYMIAEQIAGKRFQPSLPHTPDAEAFWGQKGRQFGSMRTFVCRPDQSPAEAAEQAHRHAVATQSTVRLLIDNEAIMIEPKDVMFFHRSSRRTSCFNPRFPKQKRTASYP